MVSIAGNPKHDWFLLVANACGPNTSLVTSALIVIEIRHRLLILPFFQPRNFYSNDLCFILFNVHIHCVCNYDSKQSIKLFPLSGPGKCKKKKTNIIQTKFVLIQVWRNRFVFDKRRERKDVNLKIRMMHAEQAIDSLKFMYRHMEDWYCRRR